MKKSYNGLVAMSIEFEISIKSRINKSSQSIVCTIG